MPPYSMRAHKWNLIHVVPITEASVESSEGKQTLMKQITNPMVNYCWQAMREGKGREHT